jgi:tRNA(Ile2) C34 agmatinyltransferase TiaS
MISYRRLCPKCGEPNPKMAAGGQMGIYFCVKCGYRGPVVVEEDIEPGKDRK